MPSRAQTSPHQRPSVTMPISTLALAQQRLDPVDRRCGPQVARASGAASRRVDDVHERADAVGAVQARACAVTVTARLGELRLDAGHRRPHCSDSRPADDIAQDRLDPGVAGDCGRRRARRRRPGRGRALSQAGLERPCGRRRRASKRSRGRAEVGDAVAARPASAAGSRGTGRRCRPVRATARCSSAALGVGAAVGRARHQLAHPVGVVGG